MAEINAAMLLCPVQGCGFTYSEEDRNAIRTHKARVHTSSVKVIYQNPLIEVVLNRTEDSFHCVRCDHSTQYPNAIQRHAKTCTITPDPPTSLTGKLTPDAVSLSLSQNTLSPSCSPSDFHPLLESDYIPYPTNETVVEHQPYNLPSLGIVINLRFRCIICINCERAIDPSSLTEHIHKDLPMIDIPADLQTVLENTYHVVPYSSVGYSQGPISPVFGIPLHLSPLFFCDCGRGYSTFNALRVHQTRGGDRPCPLRQHNPGNHQGYGQRLTSHRRFFEVDPNKWSKDQEGFRNYRLAFSRSLPPLRDYSNMEIKGAEDEMNTSSFFYTERWLSHLEGYSPKDIEEVIQYTTSEAPFGERLRSVAEEFLELANAKIKNYTSFGILKMMGQTTERETLNRFDSVSGPTIKKYALTLHRLVFGIIRQLDPTYCHRYRYPLLHETQILPFRLLKAAVDNQSPMVELVSAYQQACFSMFAHHQHQYDTSRDLDQFFSPVICFLVLSSVKPTGGFRLPSVITQYIAHIMFSIRATIFHAIVEKSRRDNISLSEAYLSFKQYLTSGHETPMAYYYNATTLLATIRSDETNEARFTCTDERGRQFSYEGSIINVQDITKMINDLHDRYNSQTRKSCFFDYPVPHCLTLPVNIPAIIDNLQNTRPGYSFLDDSRNPFHNYRSSYGDWLLSDPERAAKFTYLHDDKLIWKPRPCFELLVQMQEIRQILLLLCIFSAGPSSRATEVARQLLRNVPGSYRNLVILFHVLCHVDIQDKTSHKHLRDKYVPHCPSKTVAELLIYNLAVFRPFEEYLAQILLGDEAGLRYHQQLWPGLKETITDTQLSDAIGKECNLYLVKTSSLSKVSYKILFWRNLVSAILKHQPDVQTLATHQQYYIDTAMMHSTNMAVARYGGDTSNLPTSDPRQVAECIKVGLAWHKIINIGEKVTLVQDLDEQVEKMEVGSSVSTATQLSSVSTLNLSNKIIDIVGAKLEETVQETIMKAIAEMTHTYFPKVPPNPESNKLDISQIIIPPVRLQQLRSFLNNPTAQFTCPEQAGVLELMLSRTKSVLAILGTGTGKTFLILMQSSLQPELITIVVLPLSTLHDDLKRRARDLKVSYGRWLPNGKFNENVQVISVSIEHLGFPDFIKFLSDLEHTRRLGPIVFDEIHKIITDYDYRDAFKNFQVLHKVKAVLFGMTGSLPPSLYPVLCEMTGITWQFVRTPSSRKELKYQVITVPSESVIDQAIVEHINLAISSYRSQDRAIVFCRSKQHATHLAYLFKIPPYYAVGEDGSLLEKNKETLNRWISGDQPVMISTSILGCGLDYSHIRDVVHRDPSYTMMDQYQEDSRGGRDGLLCRATTFIIDKKIYSVPTHPYNFGTKTLFDSLRDNTHCLRMAPGLYLDGQPVQCVTLPGAQLCQNCEKSLEIIPSSENLQSLNLASASKSNKFSPPKRSSDIFDKSPHIDLRDHIRPLKRKRSSLNSAASTVSPTNIPSPPKRVQFSNIPTPSTSVSNPVSIGYTRTPKTPIIRGSVVSPPTSLSVKAPVLTGRKPRHLIGIETRHRQIAEQERSKEYQTKVHEPLIQAMNFLRDKCVICLMYGKSGWVEHSSDNCKGSVATNSEDPEFSLFRSTAIRLPKGWCYSCLLHQKKMDHPFVPSSECEWRGIVIRVVYIFTKVLIPCPFIPDNLDVTDIHNFREFLSKDPGDYLGSPYHNGLKLFLWIIYDYYQLKDEFT